MTLAPEIKDGLAKIFASACAERVTTIPPGKGKLSPLAAILSLRSEYTTLLRAIDSLTGEDFETVASRVLDYRGEKAADIYESIKLHVFSSGLKITGGCTPHTDEYVESYKRLLRR